MSKFIKKIGQITFLLPLFVSLSRRYLRFIKILKTKNDFWQISFNDFLRTKILFAFICFFLSGKTLFFKLTCHSQRNLLEIGQYCQNMESHHTCLKDNLY